VPRSDHGQKSQRLDLLSTAGVQLVRLLYLRARLLEAFQRLLALQTDELGLFDLPATYYLEPAEGFAAAWYPAMDGRAKRWASNAYFVSLVVLPILTSFGDAFGAGFRSVGSLLLLASHCLLDNVADFRFLLNVFFVLSLSPWLSRRPASERAAQESGWKQKLSSCWSLVLTAAGVWVLAYLLLDFEALAQSLTLAPRQDLQQLILSWNSREAVTAFVFAVYGLLLLSIFRSTVQLWCGEHYLGVKRPKLVLEFATAVLTAAALASLFLQQLVVSLGHAPAAVHGASLSRELGRNLQGMYGQDRFTRHFPLDRAVGQNAPGLGMPVYHFEGYLTRVGSDKPGIWREVNFRGKVGSLAKPAQLWAGLDASRFTRLLSSRARTSSELPLPLLIGLIRFRKHRETFGGRFSLQLFTADLANYNIKSLEQVEVRLLRVKKSYYKRCRPGDSGRHWTRTEDTTFAHFDIDPQNELALQQSIEDSLGCKVNFGPASPASMPQAVLNNLLGLF